MSAGVNRVYSEEGQLWMRVSAGHSVSEQWLEERAPDLAAQWWAAPSSTTRDRLALQIEQRLEELESAPSWAQMAERYRRTTPAQHPVADRVAAYEQEAAHLGATTFDDPSRAQTRQVFRVEGDELRSLLTSPSAGALREELARRLDAADVIADRPFIEAFNGVSVDRLAVDVLTGASGATMGPVGAEKVWAEMVADNPQAALRAEVLLAISAAGHELAELQQTIRRDGVDLRAVSPALIPASDVYARHTAAIEARLDHEISSGGHRDLPAYVMSWTRNQPTSTSLHDTERALVEHVVESVVLAADAKGGDLHDAASMWDRAATRAELREWTAAVESGQIDLGAAPTARPEQQPELASEMVDAVVEDSYPDAREAM